MDFRMKYFGLELIIFCSYFASAIGQRNETEKRRPNRKDQNLVSALQQIQLQLNALEGEGERQSSRIHDVLRATTRLEAQRQEFISIIDRSESHLSQKLEDIKSDVRKVMTLQDIIREDVEKIQQNQLVAKIRMEEQLQSLIQNSRSIKIDTTLDSTSAIATGDISTNLQMLQSTLQGLRRMADSLQSTLNVMKLNITDLKNLTKSNSKYTKETLVTKAYLQSSLITLTNEKNYDCPISSSLQEPVEKLPKDCVEVQQTIENKTGVYRIRIPYTQKPILIFCDMETDGGGWTVIQRRKDGTVDFLREWQDYKYGFGNVRGEFWLGNEHLYLMTHENIYELRVELEDFDGGKGFALYDAFAIGSEKEKYSLKLLGALKEGDIGDGMTYHASIPFSTIDVDNDRWEGGHCAKDHTGGWWYNQCDASNLNGQYLNGVNPQEYQGVYWHEWHGPSYSLMATKMMIRPVHYQKKESQVTSTGNEKSIPFTITKDGAISIDF